ncbi:MAG: glycosyltransferase 61 family protein [Rhizorhabdus sp.]
MPIRSIKLVEVDSVRVSGGRAGITFTVASEEEAFRRWRPALVRGDGARPFLESFFQHHSPMPWAGLMTIRDATIINDGLVLQGDGLLIGNSLMYPPVVFPYSHSSLRFEQGAGGEWRVDLPAEHVAIPGRTASLVCDGWQIYGHWLVDVLPRLHRIMTSGIAFDTYLFPGPVRDWQSRMLQAVGLDLSRCRFIDLSTTVVDCEELVVAAYDRFNSEVRPDLVAVHRELRKTFCGDDIPAGTRHLFVSRGGWGGSRALVNRAEIEAAFAGMGYEIVHPEILSFPDQIRLFASAAVVAGECGSGLHNALFCGDNTRIGVMQSRDNYNFLQAQIGMILNHELYYAIGDPAADGDSFSVDVQDAKYIAKTMKG